MMCFLGPNFKNIFEKDKVWNRSKPFRAVEQALHTIHLGTAPNRSEPLWSLWVLGTALNRSKPHRNYLDFWAVFFMSSSEPLQAV